MSDATSSFYLDIARKQAIEAIKYFIAKPGYRPVSYSSARDFLDALHIPHSVFPSAREFEALVKGGDRTPEPVEQPHNHGRANSAMGGLVKQVLERLDYEHDDRIATALLSVILANDGLAMRIARGESTE